MARARQIKPGFFSNDVLAEFDPLVRLLFAGLWCLADKDGRLLDRPKRIKAEVMPYDDLDVEAALGQLTETGFIVRYEASGQRCIQVLNWLKHQHPHPREDASVLPAQVCDEPSVGMDDPCMPDASTEQDQKSRPQAGSRPVPGPEKAGTGPSRTSSSSSSSSSRTSSSSSSRESDGARAVEEVDEEFKSTLEDEFGEALGTREAVRTRVDAALAHKARLNYTDQRAYLRNWLQGDAERRERARPNGNGPPGRRNGAVGEPDEFSVGVLV